MPNKFTCYPPYVADDGLLRASLPVYGSGQWYPHALLTNWLLSRGATLVSAFGPAYVVNEGGLIGIPAGDVESFAYWIWPHDQNHVRRWDVSIGRGFGNVFGTIYLNGSPIREWRITEDVALLEPRVFTFYQTVDPPSSTPASVSLSITHDAASLSGGTPYVAFVTCNELPRVALDAFPGVVPPDVNSLQSGQLIHEGATDKSLHSVARAVQDARNQARRAHLYSWANPVGYPNSTTTFEQVLSGFSVMPRMRYAGELTRNIDWAAYVSHTGAPGSEVRVRGDFPVASSTVAAAATGWITGTIEVNSEDPARLHIDGGLRDGNRNLLYVDVRRTAGTEVQLRGFCIGESE